MILAPASGERAALRGYRWQYDHIAARVYDALLDGEFHAVRLADPDAGRVDDLVLIGRDRTDGYQFKSVEYDSYLTFRQLVRPQRTRSGAKAPSTIRSLADGWTRLRKQWGNAQVHLVAQQLASVNDHLGDARHRPSPDHFSAFLATVLAPLRRRELALDHVPAEWRPALSRLHEASELAHEEFEQFLAALHLDVAAGSALPRPPSIRHADVTALSTALQRRVSEAHGVVDLNERELLALMGWEHRPRLHSPHEFPVDLDTYQPLNDAVEQLKASIARHDSGYVAVIGPPGAGKSTLLSQALTGSPDRVVRYYAYVPGSAPARTRRTAQAFLHDMVVMLNADGRKTRDRELPGNDIPRLRQQVADQLDAASAEFERTRRRTILVVDGLDHVDRDHSGNDGLLAEMPLPNELPDGVLIVVGSRTLAPLHAYARQQVEERPSIIDLQHHRLSPASILEICRRAPPSAGLPPEIHRRIVDLSNGHPLALSYLLNRFRGTDAQSASEVLEAVPSYAGDMAAEYRAVWDDIEDNDAVVEILAVCARLRISFTTEWLSSWAQPPAVRAFRRKLLYLFRRYRDGWRFFHDSFRQFAADRTALGDDGLPDERANSQAHQRVARLCAEAGDPRVAAEALYHRYCAEQHDEVLDMARQAVFRDQYRQLRSPELIREDISLAMKVAADRADVLILVRLLLALVEADERSSALEDVDMPGALYDAGLVDEAIAWCGEETRRVPLAYAYGLATRLGASGDPAGRRIFDQFEHDVDDRDRTRIRGVEDETALAWTRAATLFRPLPAVVAAIRNQIGRRTGDSPLHEQLQAERWGRFAEMYRVLIDAHDGNETALSSIASALADDAAHVIGCGPLPAGDDGSGYAARTRRTRLATISDLRVQVRIALLKIAPTAEEAEVHLGHLLSIAQGIPLFPSTILGVAEHLVSHNLLEHATTLLARTSYDESLTVRDLGHNGEVDAIEQRFRYWRLRFLLASDESDVPASVPPQAHTPAGNSLSPDAAVHRDTDAIQLATRIDTAARALAKLDARTLSDCPAPLSEAWATLVPLLDVFLSPHDAGSSTLRGMADRKLEVMGIVATVAGRHGRDLSQWLSDMLAQRFTSEPDRWPPYLRLELADRLRFTGASTPWYRETLAAYETAIATEDVHSRLRETSDLVQRHARDGDEQAAQRLVRTLIPLAFGVGYRKDYQLTSWVAWLARAFGEPGGDLLIDDAAWLARILTAADPMTEGAARSAAIDLPVAVTSVAPLAAVRIFEYLVRHGSVNHLDALAALVHATLLRLDVDGVASVELAADIAAELLARAGRHAYQELGQSIRATAERACDLENATKLMASIAARTDMYALPTTRPGWRQALGFVTNVEEYEGSDSTDLAGDEHNVLLLTNGQRIAQSAVASRAKTVHDIIALRRDEARESSFSWAPIVEQQARTGEDVRTLVNAFGDDTHRSLQVLELLAEIAERNGDRETALRLCSHLLRSADGHSWSQSFGGMRLQAAAIAVRLSGHDGRVDSCRDLAHQVTVNRGLASLLRSQLDSIVRALDSSIDATAIWPEIRDYLQGIAETLELPDPEVLSDHGCRWWLLPRTGARRKESNSPTADAALAELAVGHLSHPAWPVREAATHIVARALTANEEVARALGRFSERDASDDILENAGRCIAAARARDGLSVPDSLRPLDDLLANHPSQAIRDLAADPSPKLFRALSPVYHLALPPDSSHMTGSDSAALAPYQDQYESLASCLGLNLDTLQMVATRYASEAGSTLPDDNTVLESLRRSRMQYLYLPKRAAASRAAFGRVLGDLADAGLLDNLPPRLCRLLRTVDNHALNRAPERRPASMPAPPEAGHHQTTARWRTEIESRLDEYITYSTRNDRVLIGARSRLKVLNWDHVEEYLVCGTTVGAGPPMNGRTLVPLRSMWLRELTDTAHRRWPDDGEAVVAENDASAFFQPAADWVSFRPDLAATLQWTPDPSRPGCWNTGSGHLAVETIWWVDGWWGRYDRAFNDTVAEGHAVVATSQGLRDLTDAFGALTRHFRLMRCGHDDGAKSDQVATTRSIALDPPRA